MDRAAHRGNDNERGPLTMYDSAEAKGIDYEIAAERPERTSEGIDNAAQALRDQLGKLNEQVRVLADRIRPVLREETEDCIAVDRLNVVRATASPLHSHIAESIDLIGSMQRTIADVTARVDLA